MSRFEEFTLSVFSITRYWNKLATEEMREHGLKGAYALYLLALSGAKEEMTAARLAEITERDKADVSRAITRFQEEGLVKPMGKGHYRAPITLTPKGKKIATQIRKKASYALQIAGEGLSEEMRQNMYQTLAIISSNLKNMYEDNSLKSV